MCKIRESLVGDLSEMDESIANIVLNSDGIDSIDNDVLLSAVRRACISQVPMLFFKFVFINYAILFFIF